ncbi:MAG: ATP-binding protein [Bacteroidales bacterium]|nr:ATP-binding protein [Bacteroidales bacterium]
MSAIDLWMILLSALYHDVGMAVFSNEKINFFKDKSFVDFVKNCQSEKSSPLHEYALCFDVKDNKVYYKSDILSAKNYDSARFLLAEYVRKEHGERTNSVIQSDVSVNLPGSPIPKRIIDVLGNICKTHTQSFDKVLELPFCEAGIDHEDCHPRYIACLLRLGDLLDIDNNRFSEVLLQTLPSIPIDSILHKEKHMSVKHLQINETKIEASAECHNYEVADITNRWFFMIDIEISNQMKNWNNIVPDTSYGYLPTLGKMDVKLEDYDTIDGKERPSFKVETSKAIELLQGSGLYKDTYQCIRELLQNAVDATILRVFLESEQKGKVYRDQKDYFEECKNYPIKVFIKNGEIENNKIKWTIKISDSGIGMSKSDLLYLTTIGSSSKNSEKKKIIERMPEWMKPTGSFGIGFQSVFLLTDFVKLKTRKLNKEDVLDVTLSNSTGKEEGAIWIKTPVNEFKPFGTDIEFNIVRKPIPEYWNSSLNNSMAVHYLINTYDFTNDDSFDVDIVKIGEEITNFANTCCFPVYLQDHLLNQENVKTFDYFDEEIGLELSISKLESVPDNFIYYRNQLVPRITLPLNFLSFQINILSGDAKDVLTLNRNDLKPEYYKTFEDNVKKATFKIIQQRYQDFDSELKQYASLFINYYLEKDKQNAMFQSDLLNAWKQIKIGNYDCQKTLEEVLNYDKIILKFDNNHHNMTINLSEKDNVLTIESDSQPLANNLSNFIVFMSSNRKWTYCTKENEYLRIELSKGVQELEIADWKIWFKKYLEGNTNRRRLMPCVKNYEKLRIIKDNVIWGYRDHTFYIINQDYPQMVCPYVRINNYQMELSISDKFYKWAYENRFDQSVSMEQIKETYQLFIEETKQFVQEFIVSNDTKSN